ncbi:MAG: glycoside hydrolase family 88 protein [Vallitaleaceae bacterium]|nr:glycoside hydrolase family 88 protein [Vallitaleaceae bacterium]
MDKIRKYLDQLIADSTPEAPAWNMEKILSGSENKWNYIDGCMIRAILEMYYITKEKNYLDFADHFIDYYVREDGSIKSFEVEEFNIDNINEGRVLFDLYQLTGKEKYSKAIETIYEQIKQHPRTEEGNFWHKKIYPQQIWLDGLYMAQPFYTEYETKRNGLKNYKDIFGQFQNVEKYMKDEKTGLYYHGFDTSKSIFWCDPETGLSKNFWGRAMGWFVMAIIDVIEAMDEQMFYEYRYLMNMFKEVIDALVCVQSESGMWYQVLDQKDAEGNYLETSASAIIAYAIYKGVRLEVLPKRYKAYADQAFEDICSRYLEEVDGKLHLGGICLVAGLGGKEMRDGSLAYYLSEPIVKSEAKGVAPFLLCYTEIIRGENK